MSDSLVPPVNKLTGVELGYAVADAPPVIRKNKMNYTLQTNYPDVDKSKPLMFDTETIGLYGKIRLAQFYQEGWENPVLVEYPSAHELMVFLFDNHIVCHNASYDITTIQRNIGSYFAPKKLDDTLYLARLHFYTKEKFSLDECIRYAIGFNPYDELGEAGKASLQKTGWDNPTLSEDQLRYAAYDVYYMQKLYDVVKHMKDNQNYELDMHTLQSNLRMQCNGIPIDHDMIPPIYDENIKELTELDRNRFYEGRMINPNSWQQYRPYLGITGNVSDDLVLATIQAMGKADKATPDQIMYGKRAENVRRSKKLRKQNGYLTKCSKVDKLYGIFKPGARTGRSTCNGIIGINSTANLQQVPRNLRTIFQVPSDGNMEFLYSDFSQLELRCIAVVTGDEGMVRLYRENGDLHIDTTQGLYNKKDITKDERQVGKKSNFFLGYGGGGLAFQGSLVKDTGIYLPVEDCKDIKHKWLKGKPGVALWQKQGISAWKRGQAWQTPMGRRYVAKMMTDQLNMRIQGMGSEVAKLANHYMNKELAKRAMECESYIHWQDWQLNFMHDAYLFLSPIAKREQLAKIIADSMQEAWIAISSLTMVKDLPMPVEVQAGFNWGELEAGKFVWEHSQ